jgi:hypothetical protein
LFSPFVRAKANAPNESGRLLNPPSVRFHTVWNAGLFYGASFLAATHAAHAARPIKDDSDVATFCYFPCRLSS